MTTETQTPLADALTAALAAAQIAEDAYYDCPHHHLQKCEHYHATMAADRAVDTARAALRHSREPRAWELREGPDCSIDVIAECAEDALEIARGNVDRANYGGDDDHPLYIDVSVHCALTDEDASDTVTLEAIEPDCVEGDDFFVDDHDWQAPYAVVGGLRENPGVWGHGAGVVIKEVCAHCGRYRVTDTWAQRRDTGEQGLCEVTYREPDHDSLAWLTKEADAQSR